MQHVCIFFKLYYFESGLNRAGLDQFNKTETHVQLI